LSYESGPVVGVNGNLPLPFTEAKFCLQNCMPAFEISAATGKNTLKKAQQISKLSFKSVLSEFP